MNGGRNFETKRKAKAVNQRTDENKQYLKKRIEEESNPVIRKLMQQDRSNLDRMQVQMATAREFLIIIRLKNEERKSHNVLCFPSSGQMKKQNYF